VPRILLADDAEDLVDVVAEYLASLGYDVVAVTSGEAALAVQGRLDGAVVDYHLPDMAFLDLLAGLGAARPDCPVLVMTGLSPDVLSLRDRFPQLAAVITKPFTMRALALRLELALKAAPAGRDGG
jgi:DNA-binding response OmpR family regulator